MMNRALAEAFLGITHPPYAWRADKWPVTDGERIEPQGTVIEGPSDAPADLLERLTRGEGKRFRCLDDDGIPYFEGRILYPAESFDADPELDFQPLHDLGEAYGCTDIQYWVRECEGHESLDGAHMGETVHCDGTCSRGEWESL